MEGFVTQLEMPHLERVQEIQAELKDRFGLVVPEEMFLPHFSYHVAERYDERAVFDRMARLASETAVFSLHASGVAVFPGDESIVYIPICRTPALHSLHQRLVTAVHPHAINPIDYYLPQRWLPHITLAQGETDPVKRGAILNWLIDEQINWRLTVSSISYVKTVGDQSMADQTWPLRDG